MNASDSLKDNVTDALRYWELHRLYYNLWLAGVCGGTWLFLPDHPIPHSWIGWGVLLIMAALANLVYLAAYPIDLLVQSSHFREGWRERRWMLFIGGCALATVLTLATAPYLATPGKLGI